MTSGSVNLLCRKLAASNIISFLKCTPDLLTDHLKELVISDIKHKQNKMENMKQNREKLREEKKKEKQMIGVAVERSVHYFWDYFSFLSFFFLCHILFSQKGLS